MTRASISAVTGIICLGLQPVAAQTPLDTFEPVTHTELVNPDPDDWINWRRTLNGQGFSPLDQINRDTVGSLQLVWSWAIPPNADEITPLVHDGVMYVPSRSGVHALDAATGAVVWSVDLTAELGSKRTNRHDWGYAASPLVEDGRVLVEAGGRDNRALAAFNADTGNLLWSAGND